MKKRLIVLINGILNNLKNHSTLYGDIIIFCVVLFILVNISYRFQRVAIKLEGGMKREKSNVSFWNTSRSN